MNEILLLISIVITFTCVVMAGKYFGKTGLIVCVSLSTILANVVLPKQITLFGLDVTMGNVLFSSTYLCTDILSEREGIKESKKAVYFGLLSAIGYVLFTQISIVFKANEFDYAGGALETLFTLSARVTIASILMYFLANLADVYLFETLKKKNGKLWIRNNVSTIVCNCMENFFLMILAFWGIYDFRTCIDLAYKTCIVEIIVGLCDTPFVYWDRKVYGSKAEKQGSQTRLA